jgi:hypothetical protein
MLLNPLHISLQLQLILTARFADFVRHRSYRYASSQKINKSCSSKWASLMNGDM